MNSVAFCPRDQELMVSGGDDHKYVVNTVQVSGLIDCFQDQSLGFKEKKERSRTKTETIADIVKSRSNNKFECNY